MEWYSYSSPVQPQDEDEHKLPVPDPESYALYCVPVLAGDRAREGEASTRSWEMNQIDTCANRVCPGHSSGPLGLMCLIMLHWCVNAHGHVCVHMHVHVCMMPSITKL